MASDISDKLPYAQLKIVIIADPDFYGVPTKGQSVSDMLRPGPLSTGFPADAALPCKRRLNSRNWHLRPSATCYPAWLARVFSCACTDLDSQGVSPAWKRSGPWTVIPGCLGKGGVRDGSASRIRMRSIALETVGQRVGLSLWNREELVR